MIVRTTLASFFEEVYRPCRLVGCSVNTVRLYRNALQNSAKFLGRLPLLDDLSDDFVAGVMTWLLDRGRAPATANSNRRRLVALWNLAARRGLVPDWPTVPRVREPQRQPLAWTEAELSRLFAACSGVQGRVSGVPAALWWTALHWVLWQTGERIGAILGVTWDDFDGDCWLLVRAECRKGGTEDRLYRLGSNAVDALRQIREPERRLIFPWDRWHTHIWWHYRRILRAAGLPTGRDCGFHRMRKSAASHFEAAGGDAMRMLGHSDRRVTERYLDARIVVRTHAADVLFDPRG